MLLNVISIVVNGVSSSIHILFDEIFPNSSIFVSSDHRAYARTVHACRGVQMMDFRESHEPPYSFLTALEFSRKFRELKQFRCSTWIILGRQTLISAAISPPVGLCV